MITDCEVNCPQSCEDMLPKVAFCNFEPDVNSGQVEWVYIARRGHPFQDWTSPAEWADRLTPSGRTPNNANAIIALRGIGSKPKPNETKKEIGGGRKVTVAKDNILNFKVGEDSFINYAAFRTFECEGGGNFLIWYETRDGLLHGGNEGIPAFLNPDHIIPESYSDISEWVMEFLWESKHTECRTDANFIIHDVDETDECYLLAQSGVPILTQDGKYIIIC